MTRAHVVAFAMASFVAAAAASQKPDFSGRWVVVSPPEGAGQEMLVKHDERSLSMTRGAEGKGRTITYQLNGVEARSVMPMRGQEIVILAKAQWDNGTIVIATTTAYPNKITTVSRETWSIDREGRLIIDFTESAEGQPARSIKAIYARKR